jgi:hypothetical protein
LKGAVRNTNITSLSLINNEFKEESLRALLVFFNNKKKVLEELVLSHTKTKLQLINDLLKVLSDY